MHNNTKKNTILYYKQKTQESRQIQDKQEGQVRLKCDLTHLPLPHYQQHNYVTFNSMTGLKNE